MEPLMNLSKVFIVGDSLYATGINRVLEDSAQVRVIGRATSLFAAMSMLKTITPDVIIVAGTLEEETISLVGAFITVYSHVPILRTDLGTNKLQLIASQYLDASAFDLLTAMATLQELQEFVIRGRA